MNEKKYKDIAILPEFRTKEGTKNNTKLLVSSGIKDGLNPRLLLKLIKKECNIPGERITGITVKDTYSFFIVPPSDAEKILKVFGKGKNPVIQKAENDIRQGKKNTKKKKR